MKTLAIDMGGTRVKMGLMMGERAMRRDIFPAAPGSMRDTLREIAGRARQMPLDGVQGVGLAFPGIVNSRENRIVVSNGKYPDAPDIDFDGWARESFRLPIRVVNDARAALMGEIACGVGRKYRSAVMLIVGTGVGTAAYCDGRVLHGVHGTLGNLGGHIAV